LKRQKARFTFGDSGRLAYASMVSPGSPQIHWQGESSGSEIPRHTTRKLLENPPVYEFAEPVSGTYPPWFDPSYWDEGQRGHFRLRSQIRVLLQSGLSYTRLIANQLGLVAGVLIFLFVGGGSTRRAIVGQWPIILAACLSLGAYALVLVRTRYVSASIVFFLIAVLAAIRIRKHQYFIVKPVAAAMIVTLLLSVVFHLAGTAYGSITVGPSPLPREQMEAAQGLRQMGLQAGDKVAVVGTGEIDFWARLGRFKIVSEVASPDPGNRIFWAASLEQRNMTYESLGQTGAKILVVWNPPKNDMDPGWSQISNTNYYAHSLSK
jgi:hypothetical protein